MSRGERLGQLPQGQFAVEANGEADAKRANILLLLWQFRQEKEIPTYAELGEILRPEKPISRWMIRSDIEVLQELGFVEKGEKAHSRQIRLTGEGIDFVKSWLEANENAKVPPVSARP